MSRMYRSRKNKYGNIKCELDGITFDSKKERQRYAELNMMQKAGVISDLELQKSFELQPAFRDKHGKKHQAIRYVADFVYIDEHGNQVIEDVKSEGTRSNQLYRLKKKMMLYHGWEIKEI